MSKKQDKTISNNPQLKHLFYDSDDDTDLMNIKDSCVNFATNFDKWTIHHYYAMKNREKYPNMFFYYFPRTLFKISGLNNDDKDKIIEYLFKTDGKNINGKWGYLSLLLGDQNINGETLYNSVANNRNIINFSNSFPLKEDAKPDFDEEIKQKVEDILNKKNDLYNKILSDFEKYLKEETDKSKQKKYYNFLKNYKNNFIYCENSKNMNEFIKGIIEVNKENNYNLNNNINNNIFLLPENFKEKKDIDEEKNNENIYYSGDNKIKKKSKTKKKLLNKKEYFKYDFDLDDSFYENSANSSDSEYKTKSGKINSKSKKIINDEDIDELNNKVNIIIDNNENKNNDNKNNNISKKSKKSKNSKRDTSYKSEVVYLENNNNNNKENQIKNNFDILNSDKKIPTSSMKNPNYSTNLSSNFNLLSSHSNIEQALQKRNESIQNKNNPKDNRIPNKEKQNYLENENIDVEFYQNEQNINGYVSDFTKKVYYQKEINNKILVFSDQEDELYLKKNAPKKKQKITRIKVNEPVIIRQKDNIKNYNDFVVIGMESGYIDKNIEKLKRGLMHKKMENKKRKNKNKRNSIINELKKQYKEEDFSNVKYKGNYKNVIREIRNLEKNKKFKNNENDINIIKKEEKRNNLRSKKGNYYEIASKKNFNMDIDIEIKLDNNINGNQNKNERKYFNCCTNREKEDINFSDTDSFLSLFNNPKNEENRRRNKNNNRKFKLKDYYDNSRNQNINTFFPKISQDNFIKDRQIVISIRKLIDNEKYEDLFKFIKNDINSNSKIPQFISDIYQKMFTYSNDIDFEKLKKFKINNGYEITYNNYVNSKEQENSSEIKIEKLFINDQFDIEKLFPLMQAYLEKLQRALSFLFAESKFNNTNKLNYQQEINNFMELNVVENLLKLIIINMNSTRTINFKDYIEYNMNLNNSIKNDSIKNEFSSYIKKIHNIFEGSFIHILSEIFITFLRFFISYKPKEIKFMDVEDFCFMSFTFLQIMQVLLQKMKDLENINQKLNNVDNYLFNIPNANIIYEITNKYIKVLCLFLLNRLYIYSTTDFIPLIIKNSKKGVNFDKSSSPQESLILVALFQSISSLFIEINYDKIQNNKCDESFIMLDILFSEYVNNEIDIDTSTLGSLNELLIKDLRSYLSSDLNNCLSKEKKKLSIISNIKKVFLYNCFDIDNYIENHICIKQMIKTKIIANLIQRYLFVLISYFIYYRKNVDCLKYFNEFYSKFNNAVKSNNKNESYFDIDSIKEIIDKNVKLNLNKTVKNYLVEEYIYSDVQLMNFYDQFWQIDSKNKNNFLKNYFEIMSNNKYKFRKIDHIFKKDQIFSLINSIFELNEQKNYNDISLNSDNISFENEIKDKKDELLKSFDSILIKSIYMISESINNTLTSPEINDNENKIKNSLSKTISNIKINNISELDGNNYTLFIIPIISTILIYTQYLLKFKEKQSIQNTISKIKDLLGLESSGLMLKSFSLSLWINLIQKISERNINIDIDKYIKTINTIIHELIGAYHKPQQRGFSMQMYSNDNFNNWNKIREEEYFEIIKDYLGTLNIFAKNNPTLLIRNYSILNELHDVLNIKFYYPPKMRIQLIEIINILLKHIKKGSHKVNEIISKEKNNSNNIDEDEIMLNDINNNNLIYSLFNENEENYNFYKFLETDILPNVKKIIDTFISTENTNVINKKKILFPLYEENALLYANISGILIKNRIQQNHIEYPRYIFNSYYNNKDYDKNNIFDSVFQNYYSNVNDMEKICYIKLPFRLLDIYLDYYHNLLGQIIKNDSFNFIIKYYLELFFIGLLIIDKNKSDLFNYEVKYCEKIFKIIKANKELLLSEKEQIINEYNLKTFLSEENKNKIGLINIMVTLTNINEEQKKIGTNDFNTMVIGELLSKLSLNFNIDKIDSDIFFELINGQRTKIALNKINKISNNYNNLQILNENEINVRLHILSKYQEEYIKSQLNNKFTTYVDDFIKELPGEQLISSIVTLNFINTLLTKEKYISNKFQICLEKVFNALKSKTSCLSNILSFKENAGKLLEDFNNKDINDIISRFIERYHGNYNLKNNIYNLDINFYLKDNIINKFIPEPKLNNNLSPNIYTNLLKYISKSNNNNFNNKFGNSYYEYAIYCYLTLSNIFDKGKDINEIIKSIKMLYDTMETVNNYMINYINDIKSFYVFIFFLEKINLLISSVMRIEDLQNLDIITNSSLLDEKLLPQNFLKKTITIIECFCSFMYQYIIQIIKGYSFNDNYVHSFIFKKMMSIWNKKSTYFNNCKNFDDTNNFLNDYLKEKYGKSIMMRGYKIIEKITNNIKIYSRNDEEINKKIDFIKFINLDGIQYLINDSEYKSKGN